MKTMKYFLSFYKPYKGMLFLDLFCAAVISAVDVAFPLIFSWCTSWLFVQPSSFIRQWLLWVTLGLLLMYVVKTACRYYVTCQGHIMGVRMETDMRRDLFEQFERLSFEYYDRHNTGSMISRVVTDLFDISEFAHHGPENLFISFVKIIGSFSVMAVLNWKLTLCLAVVTLCMLAFSWKQNARMKATFMDNRKKIAGVNEALLDSLEGIRVVQSFANEDLELDKFSKANKKYQHSKEENYRVMGSYYSGNHFFTGLLYTVIVAVGGWLASSNQISVSELAAFVLYVNVFVNPLEILIEFTEMFQKGFSGFRRFEEVMNEVPAITDKKDAKVLERVNGDICFDHVSFSYEDGQPVLDDVSFTIPAGKNYALAGPSGSGKTTICNLIPRFYEAVQGQVSIDGQPVDAYTMHSLRSHIGVVAQDVYLFDGTIGDNIRYGKWNATDEEVMEAARKANLSDLIESLPDGLNTRVGERGTRLSGGQKQRISIARIFLKDPKILILDEATSALDNESEAIIQKSLYELAKNRTCLTIAHRLSTIENADEILVVADGKIVQRGTHEELLHQPGIYARYHNMHLDNPDGLEQV